MTTFYERYLWFRGRTGCVGRDALAAIDLARAERWAEEEADAGRLRIVWGPDDWPWEGDGPTPDEVFCCAVQCRKSPCGCELHWAGADERCPHWETLASLCGIADPDRDYARLVEGELASEAMYAALERVVRGVPKL